MTVNNTLLSESRHQRVSELVYAGLVDGKELEKDYYTNICAFYRMLKVQEKLTELLMARGIVPVILKGTACGIAYPRPELRAYGDIDFRVAPERFDEALAVLIQNGYTLTQELHSHDRHADLEKDGVRLELHRYWRGRGSGASPKHGKEFNDRVMSAEPVEAELFGKRFYMLPTLENGLVILQHNDYHLVSGLGLRQIIDFMLYVRANVTDAYWNTEFGPASKRYGMDRLAINLAHMCQMYLGLEERAWYANADEDTCRELMEYVMNSGNFGEKLQKDTGRSVQNVLLENRSLLSRLRLLQRSGLSHWKAAQKYRILRPFAGFYGLGRYIVFGLRRKGAVGKLKNEFRSARQHKNFLNRLRTK